MADKVVDLIYLKYLKAKITYEHDRRVETYPFARNAIREAIYNAIAHNCYMYGTPIQIRIEEEQIIISNRCILPERWTAETLMQPHDSIPYNPDIANVFYRAGYIETWGQGIGTRMMNEMLALLKEKGYKQASLAVQKANYAVRMYEKVGFKTVDENAEEYIMVCEL